ncbi:hypothetical protein EBZ37_11950, partial [bacterium]|nr:hypothetical protein [bacterium]
MNGLIVVSGLLIGIPSALVIFYRARHANDAKRVAHELLKDEVQQKRDLWQRVQGIRTELSSEEEFLSRAQHFLNAREALKAERGRVTITQAELESVDIRLRELEELSRELEASTMETKEELKILQRKELDLKTKNDGLRTRIEESTSKMEALMAEIEMSVQMQEQISVMKGDLLRTEEKIEMLMREIQVNNEQYFNLKRRYDALDVEYAQLY